MLNKEKLNEFIKLNKNKYPTYAEDSFDKIFNGYTINNDIINQIYCYLDLVPVNQTDYYIFYKYLLNNGFLTKNILEACCGAIPVLSNLIYSFNKNVTAIDKFIVIKDFPFPIIEKNINDSFDFTKFTSVVAFRPCVATECLIKNCLINNIPFCIYLCNCALYPQEPYNKFKKENWSNKKWVEYLQLVMNKYNTHNMKLKIDYNTNLFDNCPFISAQRNN